MSGLRADELADGYALGDFVLHRRARCLLDAQGCAVKLGGRAMALLLVLADHAGEVISQDQLMALAWPGLVVEPNTLRVHMASLRKALGDSQQAARYIATIPGRGYCLVAGMAEARLEMPSLLARPAEQGTQPWAMAGLPITMPRGGMIGREQALRQLAGVLPRQRLTTVVASGGMGKTTLALAAARAVAHRFEHGACFVDLSQVGTGMVERAVAQALGMGVEGGHVRGWFKALAVRHLLLVMDNCEHVLDAVAALALRLTGSETRVHVLATSCEPLGLPDEHLHWLEGLPIARPDSPALALLAERVLDCDGGMFGLGAANVDDAMALCQRLDGMPLAIELAAARVAHLGLRPVLDGLEEELLSLRHPRCTVPARHQSLDALLTWSHALLDSTERAVLRCCGLFAGGFTFDAAKELLGVSGVGPLEAVGRLAGLLGKSLIQPAPELGPGHFRLREATRAFVRMRMDAVGEGAAAWRLHRRQLSAWIAQARADRSVLGQEEWCQRHAWLVPEIRAAIERALMRPDGVPDALGLLGESWSFALALLPTELLAGLIEQVRGQDRLSQALAGVLDSLAALEAA